MPNYESALINRCASPEMSAVWDENYKFIIWRRIWAELAKAQKQAGANITDEQIKQLEDAVDKPIRPDKAAEYESQTKHDVVAHIKLLAEDAPAATPIIHLGETSQFVVDNADCVRMNFGIHIIKRKLLSAIIGLGRLATENAYKTTLGFTHFQAAQPTTVGKRMSVWAYGLHLVYTRIAGSAKELKARGAKGAVGTQAAMLHLFDGDESLVNKIDIDISNALGFDESYPITTQTYPRIIDSIIISDLANMATQSEKIATDIRLLSSNMELSEGFTSTQVGSSAMPYKKNPIKSEKICGLAKLLKSCSATAMDMAGSQWLERSLDDSITRRILIPEAFMIADGILENLHDIIENLSVNEDAISSNLSANLEYLLTEKILIVASKHGVDRQVLHEKLRQLSQLYRGQEFINKAKDIDELRDIDIQEECNKAKLAGLAPEQTHKFYEEFIAPLEEEYNQYVD